MCFPMHTKIEHVVSRFQREIKGWRKWREMKALELLSSV